MLDFIFGTLVGAIIIIAGELALMYVMIFKDK